MTTYLSWRSDSMWRPQGWREVPPQYIQPGDVTVLRREAFRVIEVRDVPAADWDEHDEAAYVRAATWVAGRAIQPYIERGGAGEPVSREAWSLRQVYLVIVPAKGGKRQHRKVRPWVGWPRGARMLVVPDHYPVCSQCGELYPCRHLEIEDEAAKQMKRLADFEAIMPGCCWHCGQPVTRRQKAIEFAGDNLLLPGAPSPVFHWRRDACGSAAKAYEDKWAKAGPDRHRRLSCTGNLVLHVDGAECSEDPHCPGSRVNHRSFMNHRYGGHRCLRCSDAVARGDMTEVRNPPQEGGGMMRL